jgi:hypothetical protein
MSDVIPSISNREPRNHACQQIHESCIFSLDVVLNFDETALGTLAKRSSDIYPNSCGLISYRASIPRLCGIFDILVSCLYGKVNT